MDGGKEARVQVFYVLAILGCGDDNVTCQQARIEAAHYTSVAQCQAAIPAALLRNTDIDYPVIGASCQRRGQMMAQSPPARAKS